MRAPATASAQPLVSRSLRAVPYYVFSHVAPEGRYRSSRIRRRLRSAANDICLMADFRDFT